MTVTFPNDAKITQETRQMAVSKKYSTFKIALFFFFPSNQSQYTYDKKTWEIKNSLRNFVCVAFSSFYPFSLDYKNRK